MRKPETKLAEILEDLKENHHVTGVKAEFGSTTLEEALWLKWFATGAGLDFTVKISGCEAIEDIRRAKLIGVNAIVAPMIESAYAAKKYIESAKSIFDTHVKLFINIETQLGFHCLDEILNSPLAADLAGIVFGRTDMTGSLGMTCKNVNSRIILDFAREIADKTLLHGKELIIGGAVSPQSLEFFREIPALNGFETRKIIFDAQKAANESGILKALEFERLWLEKKRRFYHSLSNEDMKRIEILEYRSRELVL
ncbi:MAG: hypothetical protein LBJ74_03730 [Heliobacteriaceae bacterium]|jgi:hypothetical protein|nr:hypothetical protein [Heliobacteriaceae bacterium]